MNDVTSDLDYSATRPPWFRRRRLRRWLLVGAAVLVAVPLVPLSCGYYYIRRAHAEVADLDARFGRIDRGMSMAEVRAIMGGGGIPASGSRFPAWGDQPLSDWEAKRIVGALQYPAPSSVFPTVFEVTFDRDGKVVGKHRYD